MPVWFKRAVSASAMGKKKGKQRRVVGATQNQLDSQAESLDNELKALSSIYGNSFAMLPDGMGCSVRVDSGFAQDVQKDVSMECEFRYWFSRAPLPPGCS